jgi:transposase
MSKKEIKKSKNAIFEMLNPDCAGIDIGSKVHYVCVSEDRSVESVQKFESFTEDLEKMVKWLKDCNIKSVAMESTGVYWIPVYQILEVAGFDVHLVNAKYIKNVPGRKKTDVEDCRWIQKLHSCGLTTRSFRPDDQTCILRSLVRQRKRLTENASQHVLRMQKALTEMNIQLHNVISDITGDTGMAIIKAILGGERDTVKLAMLCDGRIKSTEDVIAKSLRGDYRKEHIFVLKQELELYKFYHQKIAELDLEMDIIYQEFDKKDGDTKKDLEPKRKKKTDPKINIRQNLYNITGIDLTAIPGLSELTSQTIISEVGTDMSKWQTEKHFASWLGFSPVNKITGEKIYSSRTNKIKNRASEALRMAAQNVSRTKTALGGFFRKIKSRKGAPKAVTATARKIACLVYRLLKYGKDYVEQGLKQYEQKYKNSQKSFLEKLAKQLGYSIIENTKELESVS